MKKLIILVVCILSLFASISVKSQTLTEIVVPKYFLAGGVSTARLHSAFQVTISGLLANATYRYIVGAIDSASISLTTVAAGYMYAINNSANADGYITGCTSQKGVSGTLLAGNVWSLSGNRYGEFTTNGSGAYTGWFAIVPTSNVAFIPGRDVYGYIQLNNGAGGTSVVSNVRTTSSIRMLGYGNTTPGTNACSVLAGKSLAPNESFVLLYDTTVSVPRPLYVTFTENDGIPQDWTTYYPQIDSSGRWAATIPNNNPKGVQLIELRDISGSIITSVASATGVYGSVDTKNPTNSSTLSPANFITAADAPLPVELASFAAQRVSTGIHLSWTTVSELNNASFEIERKLNGSDWLNLGRVAGNGNSSRPRQYDFQDHSMVSGRYMYRLKQIDYNGNFRYYNLESEAIITVPEKYALVQNYPNPFNPTTNIDFSLPNNGLAKITVYDIDGKEVIVLLNEIKTAGSYSLQFNAMKLSSGIYFYKLVSGNYAETKKMLLVK